MSVDSLNSSKTAPVSSGTQGLGKFDQTLVAQAVVTKASPPGKINKSNVEFNTTLFNGAFKAQRSDPSSNSWYWGYTGKDVKGNTVNIAGQVTLKGKFTGKELTEGSDLRKKIMVARGGIKPATKPLLQNPFKQPKLTLPAPTYIPPPSTLGGLRLGTSNPYASSYMPVSGIKPAYSEQLRAEKLLKSLTSVLKEFLTEPAATRKKLNNIAAEVNTLVCGMGAQKIYASTIQELSAKLVDAQSKLNPKISSLDNAATGMIDGMSRPVEWVAQKVANKKIRGLSKVGKYVADGIGKDRKNYIASGYDPNRTSGKAGIKLGEALTTTAVFMVGGEAIGAAGGLFKVGKAVQFAKASVKIPVFVQPVVKLATPVVNVAKSLVKPVAKISKSVVGAAKNGTQKVIKLATPAVNVVKPVVNGAKPIVNSLKTKGQKVVKFATNPNVHRNVGNASLVLTGGKIAFHSATGDIIELSGDLGSVPGSLKDAVRVYGSAKTMFKTAISARDAALINKDILKEFYNLKPEMVGRAVSMVIHDLGPEQIKKLDPKLLGAIQRGLLKYTNEPGVSQALKKLGYVPQDSLNLPLGSRIRTDITNKTQVSTPQKPVKMLAAGGMHMSVEQAVKIVANGGIQFADLPRYGFTAAQIKIITTDAGKLVGKNMETKSGKIPGEVTIVDGRRKAAKTETKALKEFENFQQIQSYNAKTGRNRIHQSLTGYVDKTTKFKNKQLILLTDQHMPHELEQSKRFLDVFGGQGITEPLMPKKGIAASDVPNKNSVQLPINIAKNGLLNKDSVIIDPYPNQMDKGASISGQEHTGEDFPAIDLVYRPFSGADWKPISLKNIKEGFYKREFDQLTSQLKKYMTAKDKPTTLYVKLNDVDTVANLYGFALHGDPRKPLNLIKNDRRPALQWAENLLKETKILKNSKTGKDDTVHIIDNVYLETNDGGFVHIFRDPNTGKTHEVGAADFSANKTMVVVKSAAPGSVAQETLPTSTAIKRESEGRPAKISEKQRRKLVSSAAKK